MNRQLISKVASLNWAPTELAVDNLEKEGARNVRLTGNTVVDACLKYNFPMKYGDKILITLHRRENFGEPMAEMFRQIEHLASSNSDLEFIFPMHPNPEVVKHRDVLKSVKVIEPLSYEELLGLLSEVRFVISDSGGIQEECAAFRKKVLVCRDKTERPEGVEAGFAKIVGTEIEGNFSWANDLPDWSGDNPYGDGRAAKRIVSHIKDYLKQKESGF
jgi:UDP-N-acetylglucosamine 2-epimerase (non-hydrolysing)